MATLDVQPDNSALVYSGNYSDSTYLGDSIRANCGLDFAFTGTQVEVRIVGGGADFYVSVDGGAYSTVTTPNDFADQYVTAVTGLSDGAHTIAIRALTWLIVNTGETSVRITGGSPAVARLSEFGTAVALYTAANPWNYVPTDGTSLYNAGGSGQTAQPYYKFDNGYNDGVGKIRFKATCAAIRVFVYHGATGVYRLYVDGVPHGSEVTASGQAQFDWLTVGTGLDDANEHTYEVYGTGSGYFSQIAAVDGTLNTATLAATKATACYGDSITEGYYATNQLRSYATLTSILQGRGPIHFGIASTPVSVLSGYTTTAGEARTAQLTDRAARIDKVVVLYGTNDLGSIPGTYTLDDFQTAYENMLSDLQSGFDAGTRILCCGILERTGYTTERTALNLRIAAAVAAVGNPLTRYVDTTGWIDVATQTTDGLHPNDDGHAAIAALMAAALDDVPITVTETTLERGQSGQTLHVQMDGGSSTSTSDWTIAVGGSSGTVTAIDATDPANPILTVTAPQTAGTATLTYVPVGSTATITVEDTTTPSSPTGVSSGTPTSYNVPVSFTLPSASPAGETITGRAYKNDVSVATGLTSSPYTFAGVVDGDTLGITSYDGVNESAATEVTFTAPTGGSGTFPDAADVRTGVTYGPNDDDYTGTCAMPGAANVLTGVSVDDTTGTLTLPTAAQTLSGVTYGVGGNSLTGTVALPSAWDVREGTTYGPASGITGTLQVPTNSEIAAAVWAYANRSLTG